MRGHYGTIIDAARVAREFVSDLAEAAHEIGFGPASHVTDGFDAQPGELIGSLRANSPQGLRRQRREEGSLLAGRHNLNRVGVVAGAHGGLADVGRDLGHELVRRHTKRARQAEFVAYRCLQLPRQRFAGPGQIAHVEEGFVN